MSMNWSRWVWVWFLKAKRNRQWIWEHGFYFIFCFIEIGDEDCKMFEFSLVVKELMKQEKTLRMNDNEKESGVEQTAMTFLDSHTCLISSCKAKRHQQILWALELELHEIWQAKAKWPSEQQLSFCHRVPPEIGEFLCLAPENCDFAVYSNFCFLNNFLFKSQNKARLFWYNP